MKAFVSAAVIVMAAALGLFLISRDHGAHDSHQSPASHPSRPAEPPTATLTDASEVFQKAFWKRPTAGDQILHAERREWADSDGVQRWQWFIAVKPSAELVKHLRDDNAFNLVPATSSTRSPDAPDWFRFVPAEVTILHAPGGNMRLAFSKQDNLLYATDSGGGFQPGAPAPVKPLQSQQATSTGRLPTTPPPNPQSEPEP